MNVFPPQLEKRQIEQQWDILCIVLQRVLEDYSDETASSVKLHLDGRAHLASGGDHLLSPELTGMEKCYKVFNFKVYDENRKRLEENGFWTTNHVVYNSDNSGKYNYVTVVSWA